ncbi:hypothetical protein AMTRI_Chr01g110190 [Amborella trichopoda]
MELHQHKVACFNSFNESTEEKTQEPEILSDSGQVHARQPVSGGSKMETKGAAASSPKRRRVVEKRVISVPIGGDLEGSRPRGEGAPPSDSWAWRKYGQKPIKGSPYPRGYYRCSSSKGCPARKQVERSRVDPSMLVVTYACEHNHPWPPTSSRGPPNNNNPRIPSKTLKETSPENHKISDHPPEITPEMEFEAGDGFQSHDLCWFPGVDMLQSSAYVPDDGGEGVFGREVLGDEEVFRQEINGKDEECFADLGELPECSVVFRRGLFEIQEAAASWCGNTG